MKKYLTIIAGALLTAACSSDNDVATVDKTAAGAIRFNIVMDEADAQTRAANEMTSDNWTQKAFGIFAAYTGPLKYEQTTVSCDFMYNQKVECLNDSWEYSPVSYWPNDQREYLSFYGYAPYTETLATDDEGGIVDMSRNYDLGDPWLNFRLPARPWGENANQVDLLYMQKKDGDGQNATYTPWENQQRPGDVATTLKFTFLHALACVGDTITLSMSQALAERIEGFATITVDSINIDYKNLTTKARLVLRTTGGVANWKEIISGELTTTRSFGHKWDTPLTVGTTAQKIFQGTGLLYIPLQVRGTDAPYAEVTVSYTVNNGVAQHSGTTTGRFPLDLNLEGKKQNINLVMGENLPLNQLVMPVGGNANEPSFARQTK